MFLIIDERAPGDRVYQMTVQTPQDAIDAPVGDSPVGSCRDSRHAAVEHKVLRYLEGKRHLATVEDDG